MLSDLRGTIVWLSNAVAGPLRRALDDGWSDEHDSPRDGDGDGPDGNERSRTYPDLERAAERLKYSADAPGADASTVVDGLDHPDPEARLIAAKALANVSRSSLNEVTRAIPSLVDRLDDEPKIRRAAARGLGRIAEADHETVTEEASRIADYVGAYNVWISDGTASALGEAATSSPEEIAPLVFEYLDHSRTATRRNAIEVLRRAAEASPGAIEPVVPDLVDLLDREGTAAAAIDALAVVAEERPDLLAPAASDVLTFAEEAEGDQLDSAVRILAELAIADPSTARESLPLLAAYLEDAPRQDERAAEAVVAIVREHSEERRTVLDVFDRADHAERLHAAHALVGVDEAGEELARAILEDGSLSEYLPHVRRESTRGDSPESA